MTDPNAILRETLDGLEAGLRVRHIASFGLKTCEASADVTAVLDDPNLVAYDQIPVITNGRIAGILERGAARGGGLVREFMRSIDDSLLVSMDEPLLAFIPRILDPPYRLVVTGAGIKGIVTRSDLHKLPVRVVTFSLITHLELVMRAVIDAICPDEQHWLGLLSAGRRQKIIELRDERRQYGIDPPLLELTQFCDKRDLVSKLLPPGPQFDRATFVNQLKDLEDLRNAVAHAGSYARNEDELRRFVTRLEWTKSWIRTLGDRLTAIDQNKGS